MDESERIHARDVERRLNFCGEYDRVIRIGKAVSVVKAMSFRREVKFEGKGSRIVWEKADAAMTESILAAIRESTALSNALGRFIFAGVFMFPLSMLIFFFVELSKDAPIGFAVIFVGGLLLILGLMVWGILEQIPAFQRKVHPEIWYFYSKCVIVRKNQNRDQIGEFHKGGGKIYLRLWHDQRAESPVGKDYIFYKFNDRRGNRWRVVPAEKPRIKAAYQPQG